MKISKHAYAEMYGPTKGDRVRLGDTELIIEVENDLTTYGDEVKFGGGKVSKMAELLLSVRQATRTFSLT